MIGVGGLFYEGVQTADAMRRTSCFSARANWLVTSCEIQTARLQ